MSLRVTHPLAELPPEEAQALQRALTALRGVVLARARQGQRRRWVPLELAGARFAVALRARPGPFGYLVEAVLFGKSPPPTRADAEALAGLLGLRYYVIDWLYVAWHVREASYAVGEKPRLAPASA